MPMPLRKSTWLASLLSGENSWATNGEGESRHTGGEELPLPEPAILIAVSQSLPNPIHHSESKMSLETL